MRSLAVVVAVMTCVAAHAADKVKIGFVSTLSGPNASIGIDIRDAFNLAVKLNGGRLGGLPAEVLVNDDQLKPENAKQVVERYLRLDKVDFVTGTVFSGSIRQGDEARLLASDARVRVRGIHAQNRPAEAGRAGQRCALNLAGAGLAKDRIARGEWVVTGDVPPPTRRLSPPPACPACQRPMRPHPRTPILTVMARPRPWSAWACHLLP